MDSHYVVLFRRYLKDNVNGKTNLEDLQDEVRDILMNIYIAQFFIL